MRKKPIRVMEGMKSHADLLEVIAAPDPCGSRPHSLNCREHEGDKDANYGNDDKQLD
jgi:hypothetical protein